MITVQFFGSAKKSFSIDKLEVNLVNVTIQELLDYIIKNKPVDTIDFDTKNILVAVNDVDSSALDGFSTKIQNNDVISIIPVIHGGAFNRTKFTLSQSEIELFNMQTQISNIEFLENLRKTFPKLILQGISSNFLLNVNHAKKIIQISFYAKRKHVLLSKKIETDILMRFAATNQIEKAIGILGVHEKTDFIVIAIGTKIQLNKLYNFLKPFGINKTWKNNKTFLQKQFKFTNKQLNSINSKNPLEDLLVEKAAVLVS